MSARNPSRARLALMALGVAAISLGALARAGSAETIGRSAKGRPITAVRVGPASAKRTVMVVGAIHGTELAGRAVTHRLRGVRPPRGVALLIVDDLNPDGSAAGTRQNAGGIDLNRNFPFNWRAMGMPFDTYYPGAAPQSEPKSRAAAALIRASSATRGPCSA